MTSLLLVLAFESRRASASWPRYLQTHRASDNSIATPNANAATATTSNFSMTTAVCWRKNPGATSNEASLALAVRLRPSQVGKRQHARHVFVPVRARAQGGEAGVTYFTDEYEEIVCLDCNVIFAQVPVGFSVSFPSFIPTCVYQHRVVRRPIPIAAPEAPWFNSEDDCWYDSLRLLVVNSRLWAFDTEGTNVVDTWRPKAVAVRRDDNSSTGFEPEIAYAPRDYGSPDRAIPVK